MASRKPLVLVNGQVQQLQSSDTLDATVSESAIITMTNGNASSITRGQVVYVSAASTVDLARANASGTASAIGIVSAASISASASGAIQTGGILSGLTGLTAGATYYLDATTAGGYTATAPSTVGQYVVKVGRALSTTELMVEIEEPILL